MSRNAQAQRKLQPVYEPDSRLEAQALQSDSGRTSEATEEPAIGRVERLLRQHPSLVHEIE